jgi:hypothetical protein
LQTLSAHSNCIWDVCPVTAPVFSVAGFQQQQPSRCATCAADGTVRFWNLSADAPPGTGRLLPGAATKNEQPLAMVLAGCLLWQTRAGSNAVKAQLSLAISL